LLKISALAGVWTSNLAV